MSRRAAFLVVAAAGLIILVPLALEFLSDISVPTRGPEVERREIRSGALCIRVRSHRMKRGYRSAPGGRLVVEASTGGAFRELFETRYPDVPPLPGSPVGFSGPLVAWVFAGENAAVTSDGGRTWNLWEEPDFYEIRSIQLAPNGEGSLEVSHPSEMKIYAYKTTDFGRTWMLRSGP